MAVLNPLKQADHSIMQDTDLAGPLVFCLAFGGSLMLVSCPRETTLLTSTISQLELSAHSVFLLLLKLKGIFLYEVVKRNVKVKGIAVSKFKDAATILYIINKK